LLVLLPSARALAADGWGASWSFGPTTSRIVHAKTTLVPGRLPPITSTTGPLFLWPGMSNPTSDLVQTTMDAWADNKSYCGAATGQWCVEASVFGSFGQRNGPTVAIDPDDHVTIEYTLGTDGKTWTQTVTSQKLGKVVSTLQSSSGPMPKGGFGFATEADADSFTIDTQYYLCTELHFAEADPHFGSTGVGGVGAQHGATGKGSGIGTAKNVRTPDGGLTWLVDLITLPAMNPQGPQTAPPTTGSSCSGSSGTSGTGGALGTGGMAATGGSSGIGGTGAVTGGGPGAGGTTATGGRPSTGGNGNMATGGTPSSGGVVGNGGTGGAPANAGGKAGSSVSTTSGTGGSNATAGSSSSVGGTQANGGEGALAGNSSTSPSSSDDTSCSCSVPGHNAPRGFFALALAGAALMLRRRHR
jgi:MYXO-CTERM domain-containing protein